MAQTDVLNLLDQDEDTLKGKYLIFSMGAEMYGIEIRHIAEIIGVQPITEVPRMPNYVKGISNLRGKIIPVMDVRLRFRKEPREYDDRTCIIVIDTNDISIGLIVDSVSEVLALRDDQIVPPPDVSRDGQKYIKGIGNVGGNVKLLLDCDKLLSAEELDILNAMA